MVVGALAVVSVGAAGSAVVAAEDAGDAGDAGDTGEAGEAGAAGFSGARRRVGVPKKAFGRGCGKVPSASAMDERSMRATSETLGEGASESALTPPVNMTLQNGQPVAISSAPVAMACSARNSLMRVPSFSSMNMRAPPAPQQKASSRLRSISRRETPVASSNSRGGSKTLLWRPRKEGS